MNIPVEVEIAAMKAGDLGGEGVGAVQMLRAEYQVIAEWAQAEALAAFDTVIDDVQHDSLCGVWFPPAKCTCWKSEIAAIRNGEKQ
jgi:hypothetical protein